MNIPDHISERLETIFLVKILKIFDADADSRIFLILDPGWKKFGSATLIPTAAYTLQQCQQTIK